MRSYGIHLKFHRKCSQPLKCMKVPLIKAAGYGWGASAFLLALGHQSSLSWARGLQPVGTPRLRGQATSPLNWKMSCTLLWHFCWGIPKCLYSFVPLLLRHMYLSVTDQICWMSYPVYLWIMKCSADISGGVIKNMNICWSYILFYQKWSLCYQNSSPISVIKSGPHWVKLRLMGKGRPS